MFKGGKSSFRRKLVAALNPLQKFVAVYGQMHTVPSAPTTDWSCIYWTTNLYGVTDNTMTDIKNLCLYDYRHLGIIFNSLQKGDLSSMQGPPSSLDTTLDSSRKSLCYISGKVTYRLRNQSTETNHITAYICKVRRDWDYSTAASLTNMYHILARGFAQNGLDRTLVSPITNTAMNLAVWNPFQSLMFTQFAKIMEVKHLIIPAGGQKSLSLKSKAQLIRPDTIFRYDDADDTFNWTTAPHIGVFNRYNKFILFKADSRLRGIGASQPTDYNKATSHTTPSTLMQTIFEYSARYHHSFRSPHRQLETGAPGVVAPTAGPSSIINPDTASLGEELDAH